MVTRLTSAARPAAQGRQMYARKHALDHPDQAAIIMATSGETVTFAEYEARCNAAAHLLRAAGLKRGDHIAVLMENQPRCSRSREPPSGPACIGAGRGGQGRR